MNFSQFTSDYYEKKNFPLKIYGVRRLGKITAFIFVLTKIVRMYMWEVY